MPSSRSVAACATVLCLRRWAAGAEAAVASTPQGGSPPPRRLRRREAAQAAEERLPDAELDGVPAVKDWARHRVTAAEQGFAAAGAPREASPASWAGVVVYHLMPDRFNNGNLSNDDVHMPEEQRQQIASGELRFMPDWRHGGDLQGIRDRLGYLQDLGVQALWITPVLQHNGWYHGYCPTDPTGTDPGFGSPEELRGLVRDAHARGISVVLDIVVNHMCDTQTAYVANTSLVHAACAKSLNDQYWAGGPMESELQVGMNFSSDFFPPFRSEAFFSRCGPNDISDTSGLTPAAVFGDFIDGMFDFNTRNYDWQEIFTELMKYWVAFADLDGFRMDAAKHVTKDFLAYFSTSMRAYAKTLGKDNFLVIGEEASMEETWKAMSLGRMMSDPQDPTRHGHVPEALTRRLLGLKDTYLANAKFPAPGLTSLYNFNVSGTAVKALRCEQPTLQVADYYNGSEAYRTLMAQSLPQGRAEPDAHLWTAIEIHDWPRFLGLRPHQGGLLLAALGWLLTAPGAPILYYGVEQGFNGNCPAELEAGNHTAELQAVCNLSKSESYGAHPDALKRQDMFLSGPWRLGSAVDEVDQLAFVGNATPGPSKPWQTDEMLPRGHSVYRLTRKLVALRRSCPSLAMGAIEFHVAAAVDCGLLVYSRFLAGGSPYTGEVVVTVNPGGGDGGAAPLGNLTLRGGLKRTDGQYYVNALNTSQRAQLRFAAGQPYLAFGQLAVAAGSVMAFVQEEQLMPFNDSLGIALCKKVDLASESIDIDAGGRMSGARTPWANHDLVLVLGIMLGLSRAW